MQRPFLSVVKLPDLITIGAERPPRLRSDSHLAAFSIVAFVLDIDRIECRSKVFESDYQYYQYFSMTY